jgi:hypothetical protein
MTDFVIFFGSLVAGTWMAGKGHDLPAAITWTATLAWVLQRIAQPSVYPY